jgi:D-alanyl-D-alanine carboxypeptidase
VLGRHEDPRPARRRRFLRRGLILGTTVVALASATAGVALADVTGQAPSQVLQAGIERAAARYHLPGVIGEVRDGGDDTYAHTGWGDQFMRVPADPRAQFRIGSNTKAFTSVVLLQLEHEGRLSLDDTVDEWLPGLVNANGNDGTKITIRELLDHTSGLPDYAGQVQVMGPYIADTNPNQQIDPKQLVGVATSVKPTSAPGAEWHYSNTNYLLAGMIIKAVTGNDASTEVANRIITPLGLTHTTFPTTDPKLYGNWLHGYFTLRDISFSSTPQVFAAAGAIVSTLDDLGTFEGALFSGKLLAPAQQKELETTVGPDNYGLGVGLAQTRCGPAWNHTGAVMGYQSLWLSSPDGKRQVVVASNVYNLTTANLGIVDFDSFSALGTAAIDAFCAMT